MSSPIQYGATFAINDAMVQDSEINAENIIHQNRREAAHSLGEHICKEKVWEQYYNPQLRTTEYKLEVFVFTYAELKAYIDRKVEERINGK